VNSDLTSIGGPPQSERSKPDGPRRDDGARSLAASQDGEVGTVGRVGDVARNRESRVERISESPALLYAFTSNNEVRMSPSDGNRRRLIDLDVDARFHANAG